MADKKYPQLILFGKDFISILYHTHKLTFPGDSIIQVGKHISICFTPFPHSLPNSLNGNVKSRQQDVTASQYWFSQIGLYPAYNPRDQESPLAVLPAQINH